MSLLENCHEKLANQPRLMYVVRQTPSTKAACNCLYSMHGIP